MEKIPGYLGIVDDKHAFPGTLGPLGYVEGPHPDRVGCPFYFPLAFYMDWLCEYKEFVVHRRSWDIFLIPCPYAPHSVERGGWFGAGHYASRNDIRALWEWRWSGKGQ